MGNARFWISPICQRRTGIIHVRVPFIKLFCERRYINFAVARPVRCARVYRNCINRTPAEIIHNTNMQYTVAVFLLLLLWLLLFFKLYWCTRVGRIIILIQIDPVIRVANSTLAIKIKNNE